MVSKQKNRHIKLLFGVYIHALALFVWCISIIKYCIKRSCHINASLVPAMCWCYSFYWDTVIAKQFIGGHQSLCSLCKTAERLSAAICSSVNCHFRMDLGFLPRNKIYENVILSNLSVDTAMLSEHELIITTWNEGKCIKTSLWEKLVTCHLISVFLYSEKSIWYCMNSVNVGFNFSH